MTFWEIFLRVLPWRPRQALAALYWYLTRRKIRARNRLRVACVDLPFAYELWIATKERLEEVAQGSASQVDQWSSRPSFSILLHAPGVFVAGELARSLRSVEQQIYRSWTLIDAPESPIVERLRSADADFVVPLRIGHELSEAALFRFAEALQTNPEARILYGDEDELAPDGQRTRPWFKPRWNEEMFLAQDYLSGAVALQTQLARECAEQAANLTDLLLCATSRAKGAIVHVPHILAHVAARAGTQHDRVAAVARLLEPQGATCSVGPFGTAKIDWPLPFELPLISIIIPTKDKVELLRACIQSVLQATSYRPFEILIIDNSSIQRRTAEYLGEIVQNPNVRVLAYPEAYNFSAINNFAVRHARGEYICLLNNDTEVIEGAWLTEMMRQAVRPVVGAVGAKLLYEDGTIQHAGVVVGIGEAAGHAHRFQPDTEVGYFGQAHVTQFVSAVTAACLVVDKRKYLAVGGLDEEAFPVAFNDVDFCLKLERAGWRNVYVPHAVLLHHESVSRGTDSSPLNIERYRRELGLLQRRWGTKTYEDPLHNPNLDRYTETFAVHL